MTLSRISQVSFSMGITNKLKMKLIALRKISQEDGLIELIKSFGLFLIRPFYDHHLYYLFEFVKYSEEIENDLSKDIPKINISALNFKIVSSNSEADRLEKENFEFRSYSRKYNIDINPVRMLDIGLIAFCTFIDKELVAVSWVIPSQQAQDRYRAPPLKVDYSNHEAFPRSSWCHPKYRGLGIYRYTVNNRDRYLSQIGITMLRSTVEYKNKSGNRLAEGIGYTKYGKAIFTRVLWWKSWQEIYNNRSQ
jgi:hypothetical protein